MNQKAQLAGLFDHTPTETQLERTSIPVEQFLGLLNFENKVVWPNWPAGLEKAFGMETHKSANSFFLKTHLTVQAAVEISGYNAQYLRRLLRAGKLNGDKIGQSWLIRKGSFEEFVSQGKGTNDRRRGPKMAN